MVNSQTNIRFNKYDCPELNIAMPHCEKHNDMEIVNQETGLWTDYEEIFWNYNKFQSELVPRSEKSTFFSQVSHKLPIQWFIVWTCLAGGGWNDFGW